jgi:anti-anti-sigma factor
MDRAGLGELVAGLKTSRNFGATLKILNQSARVQQSLDITRLLPVFDIHEDEQAALQSFN